MYFFSKKFYYYLCCFDHVYILQNKNFYISSYNVSYIELKNIYFFNFYIFFLCKILFFHYNFKINKNIFIKNIVFFDNILLVSQIKVWKKEIVFTNISNLLLLLLSENLILNFKLFDNLNINFCIKRIA